ncbi:thioredoxin domain-containing protein [Pseudomonas gessardii]|uniref:Thioredoxin domain-containing protein n=2 Tax=Pseudomonas gessardii TaxID=78544 RepID=A0ABS9FCK6_9PSED|nr:thioredoxin domain-containing protein [Pseudomonas gessardii]MCF5096898.1 thioredoxin domain-containing protein [Pseudomonas gessardii]MCF5110086.1 thioredoxin domain-containing protein [Pseudomonas gessardii]
MSVACFALIRGEVQTPQYTGPWLYGPPDARWTVTEFADLECPYCKTYTPVLKAWVQQQKDVNLQWHHLPLDFHGLAAVHEAKLAECAGKLGGASAFWQVVDQTFERTRSNGLGFKGSLDSSTIDHQTLETCTATDKQVAQLIDRHIEEAAKAGITATPTLIIEDHQTGRSLKLEGMADDTTLLSAIDWLSTSEAGQK